METASRPKTKPTRRTATSAAVAPPTALPVVDDIRAAFNAGNDAQALEGAKLHLAVHPGDKAVLQIAARIHNRQKNWPEALQAWQALSAQDAAAAEPHLQVARIRQRMGDWPAAVQSATALLQLQPDHPEALRICVASHRKLGQLVQAAEHGVRLLAGGTDADAALVRQLSEALFKQGERVQAARAAMALIQISPQDPGALTMLANVLADMLTDALAAHLEGEDAAAAQLCCDILALDPSLARATSLLGEITRPRLLKARAAYKANAMEDAARHFMEVLRLHPRHTESIRALARIHTKAQDWPAAAALWAQLEPLTPADPEPSIQLARIDVRQGREEQAYNRYRALAGANDAVAAEAIQTLGTLTGRLLRKAAVCARDGALDDAHRIARLLAADQPELAGLPELNNRIARISIREATVAFKADSFGAAVSHASRAHALEPTEDRALLIMARGAHRIADYRLALYAWQKLCEAKPAALEPLLQCARYCLRFKEYSQAIDYTKKLLAIDSQNAEARSILQAAELKNW
jgi:tetratricopeptide (TPR) repeat protein